MGFTSMATIDLNAVDLRIDESFKAKTENRKHTPFIRDLPSIYHQSTISYLTTSICGVIYLQKCSLFITFSQIVQNSFLKIRLYGVDITLMALCSLHISKIAVLHSVFPCKHDLVFAITDCITLYHIAHFC